MQNMIFVYPPCTTCKKALQFLQGQNISLPVRNIKLDPPSKEELTALWQQSGLELRRFFNTSGLQYRALALKDKLPAMDEAQMLELLCSDGMLVKRPILVFEGTVLVGFKPAQWEALFQ